MYDNESEVNEGYVPVKVSYDYESGAFSAEMIEFKEKESEKLHIKDTKPFTLRSVAAKSVSY